MGHATVLEDVRVSEGSLIELRDGRVLLVHGDGDGNAVGRFSNDLGRTWGGPSPLMKSDGAPVPCAYPVSLARLSSGAIGMTCGIGGVSGGHRTFFYVSHDEGKTWSQEVELDPTAPVHVVRCGSLFVRSNGDIVAPAMSWMSNPVPEEVERRQEFQRCYEYVFAYSYAMISSDEGKTWRKSVHELVTLVPGGIHGARCGFHPFSEPAVAELRDGRLMIIGRTNLGRPYRSFSEDGGMRWTQPEPMSVASSYAPVHVRRIPSTGDLVLIWNQASVWEMQHGLRRHRLSTAISRDEGDTWQHFRNLESLDDTTHIEPPPIVDAVDSEDRFWQPEDRKRYHRAPGPLRCTYPTAIFAKDRFIATHDIGCRLPGDAIGRCVLKVHSLPVDWLYGK